MTNKGAALLEVGAGCNADCVFCLRNETRRRRGALPAAVDPAPLEAFLTLAKRMGLERVILGGDEPTVLGPGPLNLMLRQAASAGFRDVSLYSNGIELGRETFLNRLVAGGVNAFFLPLYGPDAATHDAITQRPGSFLALTRAAAGLKRLRGRAKLFLHTVLLRQNEGKLGEMRALAAAWRAPLEVHALRLRDDPVAYRALLPRGRPRDLGRRPDAGVRRRGPAARGEKPVELRYSVLLGQLNYGESPAPEVSRFLGGCLRRLEIPKKLLARIMRRYAGKPVMRDPARLLSLLDSGGKVDGFEAELLFPADPVEALALGLKTLREGREEQAGRALRDALLFNSADSRSLWAKEQARGFLERLEGVPPGRVEPCRG